jgi:hypothetical protein
MNPDPVAAADLRRPVHTRDFDLGSEPDVASRCIDDLYAGAVDVVVARHALDTDRLRAVGDRLDAADEAPDWARPNIRMPVEDLQLLGTDTPATPTYAAPRGATLDAYLASAARHEAQAAAVFPADFPIDRAVTSMLARFAGGRPVQLATASDGRRYVPYTIRRLVEGRQIGIHHDHHYSLELYRELAALLDTRTLLSFVVTLRAPVAGGELFVYGATSDDPDLPRLPNGFAYDLAAIESRCDRACIVPGVGDLFLLAAGRCLHRVGPVVGPRARITLGGFLALDAAHQRVLYWS